MATGKRRWMQAPAAMVQINLKAQADVIEAFKKAAWTERLSQAAIFEKMWGTYTLFDGVTLDEIGEEAREEGITPGVLMAKMWEVYMAQKMGTVRPIAAEEAGEA